MSTPNNIAAYVLRETVEGVRGAMATVGPDDLGEGDVLIRVTHSSVNYKDGLAATGRAKIAQTLPLIGGCNASGIVADPGESGLHAGQKVTVVGASLSEKHPGGFAEFVRVPGSWVAPLPEGMTTWESMAIGTAGLTAAMTIHKLEKNGGLHPSSGPVAVTGASGGSGTLAVAMLAKRGYDVTAITGTPSSEALLRQLGATQVLARPDVSARTRPLEHASWVGAIDTVGGDVLAWLLRTTLPGGSVAAFGNAGGNALNTTVLPFILRGINLLGVTVSFPDPAFRAQMWDQVAADLPHSALEAVTQTIAFTELGGALEAIVENRTVGRVVVELSSEG